MKILKYIVITGLLSTGAVLAKEPEKKASTRHPQHAKHNTKKQTATHHKATEHKTKHAAATKTHATKTNATRSVAAKQAPAPVQPATSTGGGWSSWFGGGALTGAAATAAATTHGRRAAGYHVGPRDWHDNFPSWWGNRGWVSDVRDGVWYFAGYPIEWWKTNYPTYYKDAVHAEYNKYSGNK